MFLQTNAAYKGKVENERTMNLGYLLILKVIITIIWNLNCKDFTIFYNEITRVNALF